MSEKLLLQTLKGRVDGGTGAQRRWRAGAEAHRKRAVAGTVGHRTGLYFLLGLNPTWRLGHALAAEREGEGVGRPPLPGASPFPLVRCVHQPEWVASPCEAVTLRWPGQHPWTLTDAFPMRHVVRTGPNPARPPDRGRLFSSLAQGWGPLPSKAVAKGAFGQPSWTPAQIRKEIKSGALNKTSCKCSF